MSFQDRLNPGDLFRWSSGNKDTRRPLIQAHEVEWLLLMHARPFASRPDIPPCQCLTCIQARRWWRDYSGTDFTMCVDTPEPTLVGVSG